MAARKNAKSEKEREIVSVLVFADALQTRITSKVFDDGLVNDLRSHIRPLPFNPSPAVASHALELDAKGLELWNAATRLRQDLSRGSDTSLAVEKAAQATSACLIRVFAFLLLEASWRAAGKASQGRHDDQKGYFRDTVRIMKVALKAGKVCVLQGELDLATKVAERAAVMAGQLSDPGFGTRLEEDDAQLSARLVSEYYILRTTLGWKQSRLEIAEHMFSKAELASRRLDPLSAEELADTLFEMGRDLLRQKQNETAARWLGRAIDVLGSQELEHLTMDGVDLRMSILQALVKAMLAQKSVESRRRAVDYLNLMEQDYPEKLVVLLLRLDLIRSEEVFDSDAYYAIVMRMVRSVPLVPVNLKTLLHHVHILKTQRVDLAAAVLDELLHQRLLTEPDKDDWIEKVLVTRVWLVCEDTSTSGVGAIDEVNGVFDAVLNALRQPLRVAAAHSVQTLLWRHVEASHTSSQFELCSQWGKLSLHPLLGNSGEINRSRIARKRIMCAISTQDFAAARQMFYEMTDSGRKSPLTRFLMFRLALRTGDHDFAAESLDAVCKTSSEDSTLLYACVVEAQMVGDKQHAALALQSVLSQYSESASRGVHLPALLRCLIRLLMSELQHGEAAFEQKLAEELCKVFETAAEHATKQARHQHGGAELQGFTSDEIEWFARSSYNLALRCCTVALPGHLIRLLSACAALLALMQGPLPEGTAKELQLRSAHCFWLMACAHIVVARAEDNVEACKQAYLAVRRCSADYRVRLPALLEQGKISQDEREDLLAKSFQLIKFELETALKLEQWEAMDELFERCWAINDVASIQHWETLADLVLVIHRTKVEAKLDSRQLGKTLGVLQTIINKMERARAGDAVHLARWLRCLFQIASAFDEAAPLQCLEQAHAIAARRRGTSRPFPMVELEWLATTAFNRAVDHYCASDDVRARLWAEKAMMLAGDVDDGGALLALLEDKYSSLSWDK